MTEPLVDRNSTNPLFAQIAATLAAQIASGELPGGSRIPSETVLMTQFGVSRMTIRHAIAHLRAQGLVVARHGSGVYVHQQPAQRTVRPLDGPAYTADPAPNITKTVPPKHVRALLGVRKNARVVRVSGWGRSDNGTMTTVNAFLAANVAEEAGIRTARRDRMTGPVAHWLTAHGFSPARFADLVGARMPDDAERIMARMSEGAPVLVHTRVAYTSDGTVLFVEETVHPPTVTLAFDSPAP